MDLPDRADAPTTRSSPTTGSAGCGSTCRRCRNAAASSSGVIAFADRPDYAHLAEALGMPVGSIGPTRGRCLAKLQGPARTRPSMGGRTVMTNDDFPAGVSPEVARRRRAPGRDRPGAAGRGGAALDGGRPRARGPRGAGLRSRWPSTRCTPRWPRSRGCPTTRSPCAATRSPGMRTETLTFSAERLTAMVTVSRAGPTRCASTAGSPRPARRACVLRMQEGTQEVEADDAGRFVIEGVPEGFAQLTFHPARRRGRHRA